MCDINKLIKSDNEYIKQIGWLLYDLENQNGELLNTDESDKLIKLLLALDKDIERNYGICGECEFQ